MEPSHQAVETARRLILRFGANPTSYQILNPGLGRWFSDDGLAVAGFVRAHGHRVVAGEPVGPVELRSRHAAELEARAAADGLTTCYFGAGRQWIEATETESEGRLRLGGQPVWDPRGWGRILSGKASLRAQLNRARNKGVTIEEWASDRATGHPDLGRCLGEWLATRHLPPMHFLVEPETLGRLFDRRIFVAVRGVDVIAFLVASPAPASGGWLVEQIIRGRPAPNGTAELLLDAAMTALAEAGAVYVTLGLSPLSRRAGFRDEPGAWWLRRLLAWTRAHGARFYDFDGLDYFKAKFEPDRWEPIYAVRRDGPIGLGTLYAVAAAFSGSSPVLFLARGTRRAVRSELSRLIRRLGTSRAKAARVLV